MIDKICDGMMVLIIIVGLIFLFSIPLINAAEYEHPFVAFCVNQGYEMQWDDSLPIYVIDGTCIFPDKESCKLSDFYYEECGLEYHKEFPCKNKDEVIFEAFEECCKGLEAYEQDWVLGQTICIQKEPDPGVSPTIYAFCEHRGYIPIIDDYGEDFCVFNEEEKCNINWFYSETCGQEFITDLECREEGEEIFWFEECCKGFKSSPTNSVLNEPICEKIGIFERIFMFFDRLFA